MAMHAMHNYMPKQSMTAGLVRHMTLPLLVAPLHLAGQGAMKRMPKVHSRTSKTVLAPGMACALPGSRCGGHNT